MAASTLANLRSHPGRSSIRCREQLGGLPRPSHVRPIQALESLALNNVLPAAAGSSDSLLSSAQPVLDAVLADNSTLSSAQPLLDAVIASISSFHPDALQSGQLVVAFYLLFTRPSPALTLLDFYLLRPLSSLLGPKFSSSDFTIRETLGTGNFGMTYSALYRDEEGVGAELTAKQKKKRVVLKKLNSDGSVSRSTFLKSGTMAKGGAESGKAEAYMNGRIMRWPGLSSKVAKYKGDFIADSSGKGMIAGSQWLVWQFETDSTLGAATEGKLGPFPECIMPLMLRRGWEKMDPSRAASLSVKAVLKKVLVNLKALHGTGIVHRDIKPENLLITSKGDVLMIDFGACADMSTGINFNPATGMLDPRYSPPEELIMPTNVPRVTQPFLAALGAPLLWQFGRPDLFDSYSVGMLLVQMTVPTLRKTRDQKAFAAELSTFDNNLALWRLQSPRAKRADFSLLDRSGGAGWDLACRLTQNRNDLYRGRMSVSAALRHPYFLLPDL